MANRPLKGIPKLRAAFSNSLSGFGDAWRQEEAFRIEVVLFVISIPLAVWLGDSGTKATLMICSILFLLVVEVLNTAIEATIDRIGPEHHELSRQAKDLGSTAVLIASLIPVVTWGAILIDKFRSYILI